MTQDLKTTIIDWFKFREVCDDEKFPFFFKRTLDISLARYNQLLRIEPGVSQYDWLVQKYQELQRLKSESGVSSSSGSKSGSGSSSEQVAKTKNDVRNLSDVTYTDGLENKAHGGQKTSEMQYGKTQSNTGTITSESENIESGSIRDQNNSSNDNQTRGLAKSAPQSISYSAGSGMPNNFDWAFPGSQTEQKTHGSDSGESTRTFNNHKNASESSVLDQRGTAQGGSDLKTDIDTRTETKAGHETITETHTGTENFAESDNKANSNEFEETNRKSGSDSRSGDERVRESGRDIDIATLLTNAKQFIVYSSAFEWLRDQLEPCFMGIYDL